MTLDYHIAALREAEQKPRYMHELEGKRCVVQQADLSAVLTALAEARGALGPFAKDGDTWAPEWGDDEHLGGCHSLCVGHLRRARAALAGGG